MPHDKHIFVINAGSSSIKFALHNTEEPYARIFSGSIERIGLSGSGIKLFFIDKEKEERTVTLQTTEDAIRVFHELINAHIDFNAVIAIGHRIVHGMHRRSHARITEELIRELEQISNVDPEHLPLEIALIKSFLSSNNKIPQVACFDTVFHQSMPRIAKIVPLPRRFERMGIERYGFHGLSCEYLITALEQIDSRQANGRVVVAHLGNGASVTAIMNKKSIDTTMGFTPTGGIPMSTRLGDVDPGALLYAMQQESLTMDELNHMINHESGLLGVSEMSSDMHDLLDAEMADTRAKDAVDLFCYEVKKRIGSYSAALGGLETIVFSGGMGENAPRIRRRICEGLEYLGILIDAESNERNQEIISSTQSRVCVRVMHTDEEIMIARITKDLIH